MNRLRDTRFGLRLLGLFLLFRISEGVWAWGQPILLEATNRNWAYVRNMLPVPFENWNVYGCATKAWWTFLVCAGVMLVLHNTWLARLLWRRLDDSGCPNCGYDRRGIAADTPCPECGTMASAS